MGSMSTPGPARRASPALAHDPAAQTALPAAVRQQRIVELVRRDGYVRVTTLAAHASRALTLGQQLTASRT
jgi:hypothetical protein